MSRPARRPAPLHRTHTAEYARTHPDDARCPHCHRYHLVTVPGWRPPERLVIP